MFFQRYISLLQPDLATSVQTTVENFFDKYHQVPTDKIICNALLLGNVQSGKTAQALGLISALADSEKKLFIYLTTDSIDLQQQTLKRIQSSLVDFSVLSEFEVHDFDLYFKLDIPLIVVLKKNSRVLKKWSDCLKSKSYLKGYSITIIDDEADSASLNTNANSNTKTSKVNNLIDNIRQTCNQCLFIGLTATPQAVILQSDESNWRPDFIQYFEPNDKYLSGNFVFSDPPSYVIRFIDESNDDLIDSSANISDGLKRAIYTFLITCAQFRLNNILNCNFIVHPGVRVKDHLAFADKISENLNEIIFAINEGEDLSVEFHEIWSDLQSTKPDIHHFDDIYPILLKILEGHGINVLIFNSSSETKLDINDGYNIIVGGNIIGRGLTIPNLQTMYYSRTSKKPNADTFWQHARLFGYDRDKNLLRLYIPYDIYQFFVQLNLANNLLISQVKDDCQQNIQIIYPSNIRPTRTNVLQNSSLCLIAGGVNYFANEPNQTNLNSVNNALDDILQTDLQPSELLEVDSDDVISLLTSLGSYNEWDWNVKKFIACIQAMRNKRPKFKSYLTIKLNREISKGTGTMLSPNDRALGDTKPTDLVLTLYQVTGDISLQWSGKPFWLPNIKFPEKFVFWDIKS